jgi:hypothetical protein
VKMHAKGYRQWLLALGLAFLTSPAFALQINNNTGYLLNVEVTCGSKTDRFEVSPRQVGNCPSNVCILYTTCTYTISTQGDGSCTGKIGGGSGIQVDVSNEKLSCQGYAG